jgi:subtilisin family serine protease
MLRFLFPYSIALLLACSSIFFSHAQNVPGIIYLKQKNEKIFVPERTNPDMPLSIDIPLIWEKWIQQYNIKYIIKPFKTPDPELQKIWRIEFDTNADANTFCKALLGTGDFSYAEPGQYYKSFFTPNDVDSKQQWYFEAIRAFDAWDLQRGSASVKLAIVDDAIQIDHPDLQPVVWTNPGEIPGNGIDDDGNGYIDDVNGFDVADNDNNPKPPASGLWQLLGLFTHGTHCAGIAGAATDNSIGIAAIGGGVSIVPVKATSNGSLIPLALDRANEGVDYAVASGAHIISMSWGGAAQDSTLTNMIQAAMNAGRILIAAAGNDGNSTPNYPSALPGVIGVGSTSRGDVVSAFSQRGNMIDVMAPGDSIWSTLAGTSPYGFQSGTSMACPMVAGLCGLMLSRNPSLTPTQMEACLKNTCDNIDALNPALSGLLGAGRINAFNAVSCAAMVTNSDKPTETPGFSVFPNPGSVQLSILAETPPVWVAVYDATGSLMCKTDATTFSTEEWPAGFYTIQCLLNSGIMHSIIWVKW